MAAPEEPAERYRRTQRRRAWIGWGGVVAVAVLIALGAILGGGDGKDRQAAASVPYGEEMTSDEYDQIEQGEDEAEVLGRLDKTGRPESLTEEYVLVLFPPPEDDVECTYWEFSDEPAIFARLCFSRDDGTLDSKNENNVHQGLELEENSTTA